MKRYYENKEKNFIIEHSAIYDFLVHYINIKKELKEGAEIPIFIQEKMEGIYKSTTCKIRQIKNIRNVIALKPIKEEGFVFVCVFDYELPSAKWNAWESVEYDSEKNLLYIEIKEHGNDEVFVSKEPTSINN